MFSERHLNRKERKKRSDALGIAVRSVKCWTVRIWSSRSRTANLWWLRKGLDFRLLVPRRHPRKIELCKQMDVRGVEPLTS
jgi:hypothetical protein